MECPTCSNPVASNARQCPKCGHRFTSSGVMFVAAIFAIMMVYVIVHVMSGH